MLLILFLLTLVSSILKLSLLYPSSLPCSMHISPSLLPSPYYGTHHLLQLLHPHADINTRATRHVRSCTSHSHLAFLTLLLLLVSGDISPNPGPPFSKCKPHIQYPSPSGNHRNPLSLISITPASSKHPTNLMCPLERPLHL